MMCPLSPPFRLLRKIHKFELAMMFLLWRLLFYVTYVRWMASVIRSNKWCFLIMPVEWIQNQEKKKRKTKWRKIICFLHNYEMHGNACVSIMRSVHSRFLLFFSHFCGSLMNACDSKIMMKNGKTGVVFGKTDQKKQQQQHHFIWIL